MIFSGEFPGAAVDRAGADGAPGDALPHAGQHLHQRHRTLAQVGPGQRPPGREDSSYKYWGRKYWLGEMG